MSEPQAKPATSGLKTAVSKDGTRIAYDCSGTGPNLVLVAGALGMRELSFTRRYVEVLGAHFTVVSYDRRGRGASGDTQPFAVQREVEDLEAVLRAVGPSHVFGMSSGAALLLEAEAAGVPMRSAIAFEPPYMVGEHRKQAHVDYEHDVRALVEAGDRDGALKLFMRVVGVPGFVVGIMRFLPMWKQIRPAAHTLPYDAAAMNGFEPPAKRLAAIRTPTLLLYGEKSPVSLQEGTRAVAKLVPGSELKSLPKQSHNLKPAAVAPVLVEFTAKVPARVRNAKAPMAAIP